MQKTLIEFVSWCIEPRNWTRNVWHDVGRPSTCNASQLSLFLFFVFSVHCFSCSVSPVAKFGLQKEQTSFCGMAKYISIFWTV